VVDFVLRFQGARCRLEGDVKLLRSTGACAVAEVGGLPGMRRRAILSGSAEGGVVSSTKTRRAERGATELGEAVSVSRRQAGVER
jgi:hypothetical protein